MNFYITDSYIIIYDQRVLLYCYFGKLADRAIYFTFRNLFFLNRLNISQHLLGRFSPSFYHMKGICVNFLDPDLFFQFLKGCCHGNRFWAKFAKWPLFNMLAFRNEFDYRNFDSKIFNGNIFSTYCANLIKIGPVTPEKLQIVPWFNDRRSFATWRSEMDWKITILISAGKSAIISVHCVKIWWDLGQWHESCRLKKLYGKHRKWPKVQTDWQVMSARGTPTSQPGTILHCQFASASRIVW